MKPKTELIDLFLKQVDVDLEKSYVIGDRESDIQLAQNIGCKGIFYSKKTQEKAIYNSSDWRKIAEYILA